MRVLLAEDNERLRLALAATIARAGFEPTQAANGAEAWQLLESSHFPIVVTDWAMPGTDGLELVRAIRSRLDGSYTYVIMLTGHPGSTFGEGMAAGADDFLKKPCTAEELGARLAVARRIMTLQEELVASNRELRQFQDRLQRELALANRVQRSLLPAPDVELPGVSVAWSLEPSTELAGDLLGARCLDDCHLELYVLDVSGHGVSAALLSAQLCLMLSGDGPHTQLLRPGAVSGVFRQLNQQFQKTQLAPHYFTLMLGLLDLEERSFTFANAGHPGPVRVSQRGDATDLSRPGTPIGLLEHGTWQDSTVSLDHGDTLILYSDGLTDTPGPGGELLEPDSWLEIVVRCRASDLRTWRDAIIAALDAWRAGAPRQDDWSLLMVRME